MAKTKPSRRLSKFEKGSILLFFAIGLALLILMGPTQLGCNRSTNGVTCSLRQMSAFGIIQRLETQVMSIKSASLDLQVQTTPTLDEKGQKTGEEAINYYGIKLMGEPTLALGRYTKDEQSQQEKVNQINQFIQNKEQNEFMIQSQDYRGNIFGAVVIISTGAWLYFRLHG